MVHPRSRPQLMLIPQFWRHRRHLVCCNPPALALHHGSPSSWDVERRLRAKLSYTNLGFALAPLLKSTISQLRDLYAAALARLGDESPRALLCARRSQLTGRASAARVRSHRAAAHSFASDAGARVLRISSPCRGDPQSGLLIGTFLMDLGTSSRRSPLGGLYRGRWILVHSWDRSHSRSPVPTPLARTYPAVVHAAPPRTLQRASSAAVRWARRRRRPFWPMAAPHRRLTV